MTFTRTDLREFDRLIRDKKAETLRFIENNKNSFDGSENYADEKQKRIKKFKEIFCKYDRLHEKVHAELLRKDQYKS
jgi:hypothetical protein